MTGFPRQRWESLRILIMVNKCTQNDFAQALCARHNTGEFEAHQTHWRQTCRCFERKVVQILWSNSKPKRWCWTYPQLMGGRFLMTAVGQRTRKTAADNWSIYISNQAAPRSPARWDWVFEPLHPQDTQEELISPIFASCMSCSEGDTTLWGFTSFIRLLAMLVYPS